MSCVYIPNMEMPQKCAECKFFAWKRGTGQHCAIDENITFHAVIDGFDVGYERKGNCPLIPAADVRPVVRGKWLEREDMYYGWNIWECSNCHEEFCIEEGTPKDNEYRFCPNCGASMCNEEERGG